MKTRFNLAILTCCILTLIFGISVASAKPKSSPATRPANKKVAEDRGPGARLQKMQAILDQLNLTDDQKSQINAIRTEVREKLQSLRGQLKDLSPKDRKARIQESVGNVRERIAAVLTEEQKTQLKEKMKELRAKNSADKADPKAD